MQNGREEKILESIGDFMREGLKDMREYGCDCESDLSQEDPERLEVKE